MTTRTTGLALVGLLATTALAQPANDDCANATALAPGSLPFTELVDTSTATSDGDTSAGTFSCANYPHSVWYRFTAGPDDVLLAVDAFEGSAYTDNVIDIYAGPCGAVGPAVGDGGVDVNAAANVAAGTSVSICVASFTEPGGSVQVQIFEVPDFVVGGPAYDWEFNRAGVAGNAAGHFLVGWGHWNGSGGEVRTQLFDREGTELSPEFTLAPWNRLHPYVQIAGTGADAFVVTWEDYSDVMVQAVDAAGMPQGTPFAANQTAPADFYHDVAGTSDRFVVVWDDGPFARLFDATGTPLTSEFQVSTTYAPGTYGPAVSMAPDGHFVVVWRDDGPDAIFARRFDPSGTPLGPEIVVADDENEEPDVAIAPNGDFVVVWEDYNYDGPLPDTDRAIAARAFASDGTPKGPAVQVNQIGHDRQHRVRIVATGGTFVVTWENDGGRLDGGYGYIDMAARRIDANAHPLGPEFLVNTVNRGFWQILPNVGSTPAGEFMVTYTDASSSYPFGVDQAVMARGFTADAYLECPSTPAASCRSTILPGKAKLLVRNDGGDPEDLAINWKLVKGEATAAADFGDPLANDDLFFCLYDAGGALVTQAALPTAGLCAGKPCWKGLGKPPGAKGFKYKDTERTPNGVLKAVLKGGEDGKAKVVFKAGRGNLATGPAGGPPTIPIVGSLTAQLHAPSTGTCWSATFDAATAKRNSGGIFQASGG